VVPGITWIGLVHPCAATRKAKRPRICLRIRGPARPACRRPTCARRRTPPHQR